jgi:hypothetical protein
VVCSTSEVLRNAIITAAGPQVQAEFAALGLTNKPIGETSGGLLPCKKILFLPWSPVQGDPEKLKQSVCAFVSTAISHAYTNGYTTLGLSFVPFLID